MKKFSQKDSVLTETLNILDGNLYLGLDTKQCVCKSTSNYINV